MIESFVIGCDDYFGYSLGLSCSKAGRYPPDKSLSSTVDKC